MGSQKSISVRNIRFSTKIDDVAILLGAVSDDSAFAPVIPIEIDAEETQSAVGSEIARAEGLGGGRVLVEQRVGMMQSSSAGSATMASPCTKRIWFSEYPVRTLMVNDLGTISR